MYWLIEKSDCEDIVILLKETYIFKMMHTSHPPRKPKPKYGMDLCKALKTMGYTGWSELVPGMHSNVKKFNFLNSISAT